MGHGPLILYLVILDNYGFDPRLDMEKGFWTKVLHICILDNYGFDPQTKHGRTFLDNGLQVCYKNGTRILATLPVYFG